MDNTFKPQCRGGPDAFLMFTLGAALVFAIAVADAHATEIQGAVMAILALSAIYSFVKPAWTPVWFLLFGGMIPAFALMNAWLRFYPPAMDYSEVAETLLAFAPAALGSLVGWLGQKALTSPVV